MDVKNNLSLTLKKNCDLEKKCVKFRYFDFVSKKKQNMSTTKNGVHGKC